ncbi:unnamed protein product [Ceutorhynchus assimilis]|uniref:Peptidase S1 domain-containing protein n=1 Tax=Ceutorhynchus assimilis TaxID=467358 RepID=A0A9N9QRE0_9CUCU|nr:unnamed protein product [Ceutorhynchus assimilis]
MRVVPWPFFLLLIIVSVIGSEGYANKEAEPCSNEYVVVMAENSKERMKPRIFGTGTLFSEYFGTGAALGFKVGEMLKNLMEDKKEQKEEPIYIVYAPQPPPPKPPVIVNQNKFHYSETIKETNNFNINVQTFDTNIHNYHVDETVRNRSSSNARYNTNVVKNIGEIFSTETARSTQIGALVPIIDWTKLLPPSKNEAPNKATTIFVFRLKESIFDMIPTIKLVKLPVPRYRTRVSSWPSNWPSSQNKRGKNLHCKNFTSFDFGVASKKNAIFTDSKGTPLELKCFADQKGDGGDFNNCGAPENGPLLCGDLQVGILTGENNCQKSRGSGGHKSLDYVPMESIFDFVVDFMEGENAINTTITIETSTGVDIQLYSNVFLIVSMIVFWIL